MTSTRFFCAQPHSLRTPPKNRPRPKFSRKRSTPPAPRFAPTGTLKPKRRAAGKHLRSARARLLPTTLVPRTTPDQGLAAPHATRGVWQCLRKFHCKWRVRDCIRHTPSELGHGAHPANLFPASFRGSACISHPTFAAVAGTAYSAVAAVPRFTTRSAAGAGSMCSPSPQHRSLLTSTIMFYN